MKKPSRVLGGARISLASDVVDVTIRARKTEQYEIAKRIGELSPSLSEPVEDVSALELNRADR